MMPHVSPRLGHLPSTAFSTQSLARHRNAKLLDIGLAARSQLRSAANKPHWIATTPRSVPPLRVQVPKSYIIVQQSLPFWAPGIGHANCEGDVHTLYATAPFADKSEHNHVFSHVKTRRARILKRDVTHRLHKRVEAECSAA